MLTSFSTALAVSGFLVGSCTSVCVCVCVCVCPCLCLLNALWLNGNGRDVVQSELDDMWALILTLR